MTTRDTSGTKDSTALNKQADGREIVHNLNGQRLGRKGLITRQRILTVASKLIAEQDDLQISLSSIAAEASLGMTSLYNYFSDLTDVLLALLEDVMVEAEDAYLAQIRDRWDDEMLAHECRQFVNAFYSFWSKHANIFHLRNNYADKRDTKMITHRILAVQRVLGFLNHQMDGVEGRDLGYTNSMASAAYMGIERAVSVLNNRHLMRDLPDAFRPNVAGLLAAEAQLLEFAIRTSRANR